MTGRTTAVRDDAVWKSGAERRYEAFIEHLGTKARAGAQRHAEHCEGDAARGHAVVWKRLAGTLGKLAPWSIDFVGQGAKFHVPDGKYRQQVFALEDSVKGILTVYMPNVVERALKEKVLKKHEGVEDGYDVVGEAGLVIVLEPLSGETKELGMGKGMVGWGKHAYRTKVSALAAERELAIIEKLCGMAAEGWVVAEASAPDPKGQH